MDYELEDTPREVKIGGIARKLAEIVLPRKYDEGLGDKIAYRISGIYHALWGRNIDLEVVLRGDGKEMIAFLKYCEKIGHPHYKEDGLSIKELEILVGRM